MDTETELDQPIDIEKTVIFYLDRLPHETKYRYTAKSGPFKAEITIGIPPFRQESELRQRLIEGKQVLIKMLKEQQEEYWLKRSK